MGALKDPATWREWQSAVDAAHACLALDAALKYGLVRVCGTDPPGSEVNVERCEEILARGAELGYRPAKDSIERIVAEMMAGG